MPNVIADYLDQAADLIDAAPILARGAYQLPANDVGGDPDDTRQCYCLVGAIQTVVTYDDDIHYVKACNAVVNHLNLDIRSRYAADVELVDWNDRPGRAKEEVVQALRGTAADLRNK